MIYDHIWWNEFRRGVEKMGLAELEDARAKHQEVLDRVSDPDIRRMARGAIKAIEEEIAEQIMRGAK